MKHAITSVVIIIAISLFGCSESSKVNDIFSKAEQLMDVQPDSALLLLQGVNTDELSTKEGKARHALLLSQAYDKNYIDLTNDSLINIAVEYYNGKRKYKRYDMLAHYYKARVQYNGGAYMKSIISATEAERIAKEIEDHFYLGLIYRSMSETYNRAYNTIEELRYIKLAYECFKRAGRKQHELYSLLSIGTAYVGDRENDNAFDIYNKFLEDYSKDADNRLIGICLHNYSDALVIDKQFSEAKKLLLRLKRIPGYRWDIYDYCNMAEVYNKEDKRDSVLFYMDKAKECVSKDVDSVFLYRVMYEMSITDNKYKNALEYINKIYAKQNEITNLILRQSVIKNHRDYFEQESLQVKENAAHNKQIFTLSTIILASFICILLLIVLYYYEITKRKNAEIAHTIEAIHDVNNIINNQKREIETTQQQIAKVFSGQFALLDELLNTYLDHEGSSRNSTVILKEVEKSIASFKTQKKLDELTTIINKNMNNIIDRLKTQIPSINRNELNLFLYLCAQFSPRVIALFMTDKLENIYNKKSRLKRKIQNSDAQDKADFLQFF